MISISDEHLISLVERFSQQAVSDHFQTTLKMYQKPTECFQTFLRSNSISPKIFKTIMF